MLVGPTLVPIERFLWFKDNVTSEEKEEHNLKRKSYWLFNVTASFMSHGIILIIIIILWETTSLLDQNLSTCTFPIVKNNVSYICGIVLILGGLNCLMTYLFYKS